MELWVIGQSDTYSLQAKNKKVKRNNLKNSQSLFDQSILR